MDIITATPDNKAIVQTGSGPVEVSQVHDAQVCTGRTCIIHNPSDHHMRDWKVIFKHIPAGLHMERLCPHGVGHPDPDSVSYFTSIGEDHVSVHGCDGCCTTDQR